VEPRRRWAWIGQLPEYCADLTVGIYVRRFAVAGRAEESQGKCIAVITGASRGLGRRMALHLAQREWVWSSAPITAIRTRPTASSPRSMRRVDAPRCSSSVGRSDDSPGFDTNLGEVHDATFSWRDLTTSPTSPAQVSTHPSRKSPRANSTS
jgi:hypothetical protein